MLWGYLEIKVPLPGLSRGGFFCIHANDIYYPYHLSLLCLTPVTLPKKPKEIADAQACWTVTWCLHTWNELAKQNKKQNQLHYHSKWVRRLVWKEPLPILMFPLKSIFWRQAVSQLWLWSDRSCYDKNVRPLHLWDVHFWSFDPKSGWRHFV